MLDFFLTIVYNANVADDTAHNCGGGGTGRRARLRGVWATVRVQVPSSAPKRNDNFLSEDCRFFLFFSLFSFRSYRFSKIVVSGEKIREKREEKR